MLGISSAQSLGLSYVSGAGWWVVGILASEGKRALVGSHVRHVGQCIDHVEHVSRLHESHRAGHVEHVSQAHVRHGGRSTTWST